MNEKSKIKEDGEKARRDTTPVKTFVFQAQKYILKAKKVFEGKYLRFLFAT